MKLNQSQVDQIFSDVRAGKLSEAAAIEELDAEDLANLQMRLDRLGMGLSGYVEMFEMNRKGSKE